MYEIGCWESPPPQRQALGQNWQETEEAPGTTSWYRPVNAVGFFLAEPRCELASKIQSIKREKESALISRSLRQEETAWRLEVGGEDVFTAENVVSLKRMERKWCILKKVDKMDIRELETTKQV